MHTELAPEPHSSSSYSSDPASRANGAIAVDDFVLPADTWLRGPSACDLATGEYSRVPLVDDCC